MRVSKRWLLLSTDSLLWGWFIAREFPYIDFTFSDADPVEICKSELECKKNFQASDLLTQAIMQGSGHRQLCALSRFNELISAGNTTWIVHADKLSERLLALFPEARGLLQVQCAKALGLLLPFVTADKLASESCDLTLSTCVKLMESQDISVQATVWEAAAQFSLGCHFAFTSLFRQNPPQIISLAGRLLSDEVPTVLTRSVLFFVLCMGSRDQGIGLGWWVNFDTLLSHLHSTDEQTLKFMLKILGIITVQRRLEHNHVTWVQHRLDSLKSHSSEEISTAACSVFHK